jgi:tetratricopeptide (TPR) repeat protein
VDAVTDRRRGPVLAALTEAMGEAADGSGRLVLVLGEAGIGKTTMARSLASTARRRGLTVRWAACWSGGATVAHAPWSTLLAGLGAPGQRALEALARTPPGEAGAADANAARSAAYTTVVAALEEATTERPALLVLDDLHWADEGTLQLLDVVAAHVPALPILVVGTYRDTDVPAGSRLATLGGRAERVELRGLDPAAVEAVLTEHIGSDPADRLAGDITRLTGGNPFLVVQVGRLLAQGASAEHLALPAGARDLLHQRLDALLAEDRGVIVAGAVLASPFRAVDVAQVVAASTAAVNASLERAAALRIVERAPGTGAWSFVHDLFRLAALELADATEIADLHRRAAAVQEEAGAEPAVVARHLLASGHHPRAGAMWSVRAGERALGAMAWEEAAAHYQRALDVVPTSAVSDTRVDALAGLGRARLLAGDDAAAARAFEELAAIGRALGSASVLARAALGFSADLSGFEVRLFDQRQIQLLEEAAEALATAGDLATRAVVLARLSVALSLSAPDIRRLYMAETAVALARAADRPPVLAVALAAHCDAIAGPDHAEQREAEASEIIAIAEAYGDGPVELLGRRLRFVARLEQVDVAGVDEDTRAFTRRADTMGNPLYSWYVPLWKAQLALVAGDVDAAEAYRREAEQLGRAAGSTNAVVLVTVLELMDHWQRGDYAGAVARIETLDDDAPGLSQYLSAVGSLAWAHYLAGRRARAVDLLDRATARGLDSLPLDAEWLPNLVNLVRAAAALGHPILGDIVSRLEVYAGLVAFEGIGAGLYGSVARIVAIGCTALGRHDDAVRHAEHGLAMNRRFGGTLVGDALRTLAEAVAARDGASSGRAESLHAEADAVYQAVGAHHLVRAVAPPAPAPLNELRRDGDVWRISFAGTSTIVKHSKGLADLATLLDRPSREVHVTELDGAAAGYERAAGEALDRTAIAAYRERLGELAVELDDAEAAHDLARAERARMEYDALVDQLAAGVGLGGRRRSAGPDPIERLRKAVTARIRDAIHRIDAVHPPLGRHLTNAVRTGTYCSYQPETPTVWETSS